MVLLDRFLHGGSDHFGADMEVAVIVLLLLVIILAAFMLYREFQHVSGRMTGLEERMKKLEHASRKRMPYEALDKLLNARAALDRYKTENKFFDELITNAEAWLDSAMAEGTKRESKNFDK